MNVIGTTTAQNDRLGWRAISITGDASLDFAMDTRIKQRSLTWKCLPNVYAGSVTVFHAATFRV